MQPEIYPCLWFDGQAEEAMRLYVSAFPNSSLLDSNPLVTRASLNGRKLMGLNGGPRHKPNPSISLFVQLETEAEIEAMYARLAKGGQVMMPLGKYDWSDCYAFFADRFGVAWQLMKGPFAEVGQSIAPCLLFVGEDFGKAEAALRHYTHIFPNSSVDGILHNPKAGLAEPDSVMHSQFRLGENVFMAMDGAGDHKFRFTEGVSFVVECDTQIEIDYFWQKLSEGGREDMCGWVKDAFGVSWQIVPAILRQLMADPAKAPRVTQAFLQMRKFDIQALVDA